MRSSSAIVHLLLCTVLAVHLLPLSVVNGQDVPEEDDVLVLDSKTFEASIKNHSVILV